MKASRAIPATMLLCAVLLATTARAQEFIYRLGIADPPIVTGPKVDGVASATVPIASDAGVVELTFDADARRHLDRSPSS